MRLCISFVLNEHVRGVYGRVIKRCFCYKLRALQRPVFIEVMLHLNFNGPPRSSRFNFKDGSVTTQKINKLSVSPSLRSGEVKLLLWSKGPVKLWFCYRKTGGGEDKLRTKHIIYNKKQKNMYISFYLFYNDISCISVLSFCCFISIIVFISLWLLK